MRASPLPPRRRRRRRMAAKRVDESRGVVGLARYDDPFLDVNALFG
jgi:hypothetical protein